MSLDEPIQNRVDRIEKLIQTVDRKVEEKAKIQERQLAQHRGFFIAISYLFSIDYSFQIIISRWFDDNSSKNNGTDKRYGKGKTSNLS